MPKSDTKLTKLHIELPDALYEEAKAAGLLEPETLRLLIREHLRRMAGENLLKTMDDCQKANAHLPPMTWDDINASIEEVRQEKQGQYEWNTEQSSLAGS